jgi:CoA-transferase family III
MRQSLPRRPLVRDPTACSRQTVVDRALHLGLNRIALTLGDPAQMLITRLPAAVLPVKLTLSTPGWRTRCSPTSRPAGTTVQPAASAGASLIDALPTGAFQGTMAATTPIGSRMIRPVPPAAASRSSSKENCSSASVAAEYIVSAPARNPSLSVIGVPISALTHLPARGSARRSHHEFAAGPRPARPTPSVATVPHRMPCEPPRLRESIRGAIASRTRDEWALVFDGTDACVTPVLTLTEALSHPHAVARSAFVTIDGIDQPARTTFRTHSAARSCEPRTGRGWRTPLSTPALAGRVRLRIRPAGPPRRRPGGWRRRRGGRTPAAPAS